MVENEPKPIKSMEGVTQKNIPPSATEIQEALRRADWKPLSDFVAEYQASKANKVDIKTNPRVK